MVAVISTDYELHESREEWVIVSKLHKNNLPSLVWENPSHLSVKSSQAKRHPT